MHDYFIEIVTFFSCKLLLTNNIHAKIPSSVIDFPQMEHTYAGNAQIRNRNVTMTQSSTLAKGAISHAHYHRLALTITLA